MGIVAHQNKDNKGNQELKSRTLGNTYEITENRITSFTVNLSLRYQSPCDVGPGMDSALVAEGVVLPEIPLAGSPLGEVV